MNENKLKEAAKEARRQYGREWRKKNPEKVREYNDRYWLKKAAAVAEVNHVER